MGDRGIAILSGNHMAALAAVVAATQNPFLIQSPNPRDMLRLDNLDLYGAPKDIHRGPIRLGNSPPVHRVADPATKAARKAQRKARRKSR
ncbi:hypothetical protein [Rhizobium sp. Leaf383]|uniref:hypothetical protein n=1 Tax=Rhizobium sp. Leaf383 TaxID=1736357 RepID=UPI00071278A2|nr:hypothetical protein [Rhizobium sp. Leaf383]KQS84280.1 hypothetical protein ASG58_21150 [Rhizobium sp. Leaf383]